MRMTMARKDLKKKTLEVHQNLMGRHNQKIKPQNDSSMHDKQKRSSFDIVHLCFAQDLDSHNTQKT
jgi:hypothetical protein